MCEPRPRAARQTFRFLSEVGREESEAGDSRLGQRKGVGVGA